jgi:hypothetical protein
MSKEKSEALACKQFFLEEDDELDCVSTEGNPGGSDTGKRSATPISLICPDTGKVTMHFANELRALLQQFRVEQNTPACHMAHQLQPRSRAARAAPVAVDDELHGPDGEWLVVEEATPDGNVFTLFCCETGARFRRTASAVLADIGRRRLKVLRPGMPYMPPELEEAPRVFVDQNGCF